jgi:uncharacterized protein (TIRG00374 family)
LLLLATGLSVWRRLVETAARTVHRLLGWPSKDRLREFNWAVAQIKVGKCAVMSVLCLLVFCLQCYLMLNSAGPRYDFVVVRFVPLVFLANLAPITIGGLGLRETIGVLLLSGEGIPAAVAMTSFALVSIVNLFLPAVIGAALYALRPAGGAAAATEQPTPESAPAGIDETENASEPPAARPSRWKATAAADVATNRMS